MKLRMALPEEAATIGSGKNRGNNWCPFILINELTPILLLAVVKEKSKKVREYS